MCYEGWAIPFTLNIWQHEHVQAMPFLSLKVKSFNVVPTLINLLSDAHSFYLQNIRFEKILVFHGGHHVCCVT